MTQHDHSTENDFLCEKRLRETDEHLHSLFRGSVFAMDILLKDYLTIFPYFTDHSYAHSEQVINYCNLIAGNDIISALNPDEVYILLMGAALHDVGMGVSEADFTKMRNNIPGLNDYADKHPEETMADYVRVFHQELSAQFIKKYSGLFEIPSEEHTHCIAQVARGHRKADLFDPAEYPADFLLPNGNRVNLAYLAALVKLADELDVMADRNLLLDYRTSNSHWSEKQRLCYMCHGALKTLELCGDELILSYETDEADVEREILSISDKVDETFLTYSRVVEERSGFKNRIRSIVFRKIKA